MSIYEYDGKRPSIGEGTYIFKTADVIGDVVLGKNCYVGPGARLRGDYGKIVVGNGTAIEENVVIHARPGDITRIGSNVTVGHGAIVHNATLKDWAVVGMGSVVSDWAVVGEWSVVGEGAVVKNHQKIPDEAVVVGIPAREVSTVSVDYKKQWKGYKKIYIELARDKYPNTLKQIG